MERLGWPERPDWFFTQQNNEVCNRYSVDEYADSMEKLLQARDATLAEVRRIVESPDAMLATVTRKALLQALKGSFDD